MLKLQPSCSRKSTMRCSWVRRMAHRLPVHGGRPASGQRIGHHQVGCRERSRTLACALKQARRRGSGTHVISSGRRRRCKRRLLVPDGYRVCATNMRQKWTVWCTAATVHILVRCAEAVRSDPTRHRSRRRADWPTSASKSFSPPSTDGTSDDARLQPFNEASPET